MRLLRQTAAGNISFVGMRRKEGCQWQSATSVGSRVGRATQEPLRTDQGRFQEERWHRGERGPSIYRWQNILTLSVKRQKLEGE